MGKVRIGTVYSLPEFWGKGGAKKGRFLPSKAWTWGRITLLNLPTANVLAIADIDGMLGVQAAGAFWILAGISANCPVPGYLLETDHLGAARAMSDERIAKKLDIDPRAWGEIAGAMLDVGALARTDTAIFIPDEFTGGPPVDKQTEFSFCDPRHWNSNGAHNELNQTELNQNEMNQNETKPPAPPRTGPDREPRPAGLRDGVGDVSQLRAAVINLTIAGRYLEGVKAADAFAAELLGGLWTSTAQGHVRRAYGSLYRSTGDPAVRTERVNAWLDCIEDVPNLSHIESPGAWLKAAAATIGKVGAR